MIFAFADDVILISRATEYEHNTGSAKLKLKLKFTTETLFVM